MNSCMQRSTFVVSVEASLDSTRVRIMHADRLTNESVCIGAATHSLYKHTSSYIETRRERLSTCTFPLGCMRKAAVCISLSLSGDPYTSEEGARAG